MSNGVVIPPSQLRAVEHGDPNRVYGARLLQPVAVQRSDSNGVIHKEIWYMMDGALYAASNAEEQANALHKVSDRAQKEALSLLAAGASSANAKSSDSVQVL